MTAHAAPVTGVGSWESDRGAGMTLDRMSATDRGDLTASLKSADVMSLAN